MRSRENANADCGMFGALRTELVATILEEVANEVDGAAVVDVSIGTTCTNPGASGPDTAPFPTGHADVVNVASLP